MELDEQSVFSQQSLPAILLSHEEVKPQSRAGRRKSTRVQEYRRKLKQRRNRRIVFIVFATTASLALGVTYKINHPEFTFQQYFAVEDLNVTTLDRMLDAAANRTMAAIGNKANATADEAAPQKEIKKKTRSKSKPKPERMKRVVPEVVHEPPKPDKPPKVVKPNPKPNPLEPPKPTVQPKKSEGTVQLERTEKKNRQRVQKEESTREVQEVTKEEEVQVVLTEKKERRPPVCNIPLAYIHPRCRRIASSNPVFNLHALVQDMMQ